jgi:hypothetical protein
MDQILAHEVIKEIGRQRQKAEEARNRRREQTVLDEQIGSGSETGARSRVGRALARAGRYLRLGTAPRPEPLSN